MEAHARAAGTTLDQPGEGERPLDLGDEPGSRGLRGLDAVPQLGGGDRLVDPGARTAIGRADLALVDGIPEDRLDRRAAPRSPFAVADPKRLEPRADGCRRWVFEVQLKDPASGLGLGLDDDQLAAVGGVAIRLGAAVPLTPVGLQLTLQLHLLTDELAVVLVQHCELTFEQLAFTTSSGERLPDVHRVQLGLDQQVLPDRHQRPVGEVSQAAQVLVEVVSIVEPDRMVEVQASTISIERGFVPEETLVLRVQFVLFTVGSLPEEHPRAGHRSKVARRHSKRLLDARLVEDRPGTCLCASRNESPQDDHHSFGAHNALAHEASHVNSISLIASLTADGAASMPNITCRFST